MILIIGKIMHRAIIEESPNTFIQKVNISIPYVYINIIKRAAHLSTPFSQPKLATIMIVFHKTSTSEQYRWYLLPLLNKTFIAFFHRHK